MKKCAKFIKDLFLLHDWAILALLFVGALVVRLALLSPLNSLRLSSDDAIYMSMARYLSEGNFFGAVNPYWSPLFPIMSSFSNIFVNNWNLAGRMVSVFSGALLVIPLYLIGKTYFNKMTGFLFALYSMFYFPLLYSSTQSLTEPLQTLLFWISVLFYLKLQTNKKLKWAILTGFTCGLTFLTRSEGAFSLIAIVIVFISMEKIYFKHNPRLTSMTMIKVCLMLILGFLILYIPYNFALFVKYKQSVSTAKISAFLNNRGEYTLNSTQTSTWGQDFDSLETFNPNSEFSTGFKTGINLQKMYKNVVDRVPDGIPQTFKYISLIEVVIFLFGIYKLLLNNSYGKILIPILTIIILAFIPMTEFTPIHSRYVYWFSPLVSFGISFGAVSLLSIIKNSRKKLILYAIFLILLIFRSSSDVRKVYAAQKRESGYLSQELINLLKGKRVMARKEGGYIFASRSLLVYAPSIDDYKQFMNYAKRWKVDYILAEEGSIDTPVYYLFEKPKDYPGLKMILADYNNKTYAYKVL